MIVVKLTGGVGNQMFQYAVGKRLSILNNTELKLDITHYDTLVLPNGLPYRSFDLSMFKLDVNIAKRNDISKFHCLSASLLERIKRKLFNGKTVYEPHFHFYPELLEMKGSLFLEGYWQSEKYFLEIQDVIREAFTIKTQHDPRGLELIKKIQSTNSICLNIRRQEFASNRYPNQFVGLDYIQNAVEIIAKKISNPHFYIFSDELSWVRENLKLKYKSIIVDDSYYGDKYRNCLDLMTKCKHFIIPNSTFAWWAAWLSKNENKVVIAPEKWLNEPTINTKDVIPDNWIKI